LTGWRRTGGQRAGSSSLRTNPEKPDSRLRWICIFDFKIEGAFDNFAGTRPDWCVCRGAVIAP